jgi:hypothetical protein
MKNIIMTLSMLLYSFTVPSKSRFPLYNPIAIIIKVAESKNVINVIQTSLYFSGVSSKI